MRLLFWRKKKNPMVTVEFVGTRSGLPTFDLHFNEDGAKQLISVAKKRNLPIEMTIIEGLRLLTLLANGELLVKTWSGYTKLTDP